MPTNSKEQSKGATQNAGNKIKSITVSERELEHVLDTVISVSAGLGGFLGVVVDATLNSNQPTALIGAEIGLGTGVATFCA